MLSTCISQVAPSGVGTVKRGRGRPPGTRNKATLIAQAKLLNRVKTASGGPKDVPLSNGNTTRVTIQHLTHLQTVTL